MTCRMEWTGAAGRHHLCTATEWHDAVHYCVCGAAFLWPVVTS